MQDPSKSATVYPAPPPCHQPNGGQAPPPVTAYPYAAPTPYPQNQYHNPYPSRNCKVRSFLDTMCLTVLCVWIIFVLILAVTCVVISLSPSEFGIDSFSVTNLSANSTNVSGTWDVGFLVRNKNKITINYGDLQFYIYYMGEYLSEAKLPPFKQGPRSEMTLNATISALDTYVRPRTVSALNAERTSGSIWFDVQIGTFRSGWWIFQTWWLQVSCRDVPVRLSSNRSEGKLTGGAIDCHVI